MSFPSYSPTTQRRRRNTMGLGPTGSASPTTPFASSLMPGAPQLPLAAPQSATTGTTPMAPTSPWGNPNTGAPLRPLGHVQGGARGMQQRAGNLGVNNARRTNPFLWQQLMTLVGQGNENRMSDANRSAFLAPREAVINQQYEQAQGNLSRGLGERGLGDSGAMAAGMGALDAGRLQANASMNSDMTTYEDERQRAAQMAALQGLFSMSGQGQAGAGILGNVRQGDQAQEQIDNSQKFDWAGLLQGIIGGAGTAAGMGAFGGMGSAGGSRRKPYDPYADPWSGYGDF